MQPASQNGPVRLDATFAPHARARLAFDRLRVPLHALLRTRVVDALVAPRDVDDYLELVDPCWSLERVRARVVEVRHETADTTSLLLRANQNWHTHRAGQHVSFTATVAGTRHTRCFSLSSAPQASGLLRVTIKAHATALVSRWARDTAKVGDVVTLSQAQGEFVLPEVLPERLLFISGGSGMTPLVAMAQALVAARYQGQLRWLHYERDALPLEGELHALVAALPGARFERVRTGAAQERHLSAAALEGLATDWTQYLPFVCGPRSLLVAARALFAERGLGDRMRSERFQLDVPASRPNAAAGVPRTLVFARSGRTALARADVSLLDQAEQAGLRPRHGCRMGICHTCTCTKRSGSVRNVLTGMTSDASDEEIQLCIHTPLSDVSLDL